MKRFNQHVNYLTISSFYEVQTVHILYFWTISPYVVLEEGTRHVYKKNDVFNLFLVKHMHRNKCNKKRGKIFIIVFPV